MWAMLDSNLLIILPGLNFKVVLVFTLHFTPLSLKHFVTIFTLFFLTAKGESCD